MAVSSHDATRLLSHLPKSDVHFDQLRYCSILFEDEPLSTLVTTVNATPNKGQDVQYSIVGGNEDGLFAIDKSTGDIFLAAYLDRETKSRHELVVSAEAGSYPAQSLVQITVADVNDNAPVIIEEQTEFVIVEEDDRGLPNIIGKVEAKDADWIDKEGLHYTISGDGIDGYTTLDAYFNINSTTGEIIQLRPLDRDAPKGKPIWTLKVKVHDGQAKWSNIQNLKTSLNFKKHSLKSTRKRETNLLRHRGHLIPKMNKWVNDLPSEMHLIPFDLEMDSELGDFSIKASKNKKIKLSHSGSKSSLHYEQMRKIRPRNTKYIGKRSITKLSTNRVVSRKHRLSRITGKLHKYSTKIGGPNISMRLLNSNTLLTRKAISNDIVNLKPFKVIKTSMRKMPNMKRLQKHFRNNIKNIRSHQKENLRFSRDAKEASMNKTTLITSDYHSTTESLNSNFDDSKCIRFDILNPAFDADNEAQLNYLSSEAMLLRATGQIHVKDIDVTVVVKDVNDNAPVFLDKPIYGEVQENGPIDLPVVKLEAHDADDVDSGTNALLSYSIEKNVVDDETGEPLFNIDVNDGWLKTAVCCLDRETTPEYHLQVVASDGGGLKGTGTVVVRLSDLNDNPPRLSRREWDISVDETDGNSKPDGSSILQMTADDPDTSNYFLFRIVPGSGNGWQKFGLRTRGNVGAVYVVSSLDYEDEKQRRGLRFLVEVTDRGPGGWDDRRHVDSAWVSVTLKDINDNSPTFKRSIANVTIREDAQVGTLLETFFAEDPDEGENGNISYSLVDPSDSLSIDQVGSIRIRSSIDREGPIGVNGTILVTAVDGGDTPRSSTAVLYVNIEDVNDSPPRLLPPTVIHVLENFPPQVIGELVATDDDIWELGHGPPFTMQMSNFNSDFVKQRLELRFSQGMHGGNGGAKVLTKSPLDREECRHMTLKVTLSDAGGLTSTADVDIIVDDVNDNPMKPGSKTVFLWKTLGTSSKAPLGRVFVEDSDDWDGADKRYHWANSPHPLFDLDEESGNIFATAQVREGRYDLQFIVSDSLWGQKNISATVSILVRLLSPEALTHAVPLTISPITATSLSEDWLPNEGGGKLGLLANLVEKHLADHVSEVKIVSVYDASKSNLLEENRSESHRGIVHYSSVGHLQGNNKTMKFRNYPGIPKQQFYNIKQLRSHENEFISSKYINKKINNFGSPSACVWISAKDTSGEYMDVVNFGGFLELNLQQIEEKLNLSVQIGSFQELSTSTSDDLNINTKTNQLFNATPSQSSISLTPFPTDLTKATADPSAAASLASVSLPLHVVDSNRTALVTPRLTSSRRCISPLEATTLSNLSCPQVSCLNGGRCIPTETTPKCICPGHTDGPFCFIVSRSFSVGSWIWLKPLNSCLPLHISFRFLTRYPEGILMYSGPLSSSRKFDSRNKDVPFLLVLQISKGRPQLILRRSKIALHLEIENSSSVNDEKWHYIHVKITNKGVSMMLDYCATGNKKAKKRFRNCLKYAPFTNSLSRRFWVSSSPLQVGGLASSPPVFDGDSKFKIVDQSLRGCISELRLSNELIDLGEPKYSHNSYPGCFLQDRACNTHNNDCNGKGICSGLRTEAFCSCPQGWTGKSCKESTETVSMSDISFIKLALSFNPDPLWLTFSLRLRTKLSHGIVFKLSSQNNFASLTLKVSDGAPCLFYQTRSSTKKKTSTVSIVGITSTSSVKALNLSSTFYIKNWNQYNIAEKQNSSGMFTSNKLSFTDSNSEAKTSTISACLSGHVISDGSWYEVNGGRFGYNLILEMKTDRVLKRNETLGMYNIYKRRLGEKVKKKLEKKDPPDKFIVDPRDGLTIGDFVDLQPTLRKEDSADEPTMCIDDFRISGRQLPLPPSKNGSRWAQVAATSGVRSGCLTKTQCEPNSCPSNFKCKESLGRISCGCPANHRLSQDGCKPFEVCQFNPCLNDGFCKTNDNAGFTCTCLPRFEGEHCQWRVNDNNNNGIFSSIVVGSSVAVFLLLVIIVVLSCRRFQIRRRRRKKREKDEDKSFDSDTDKGNKEYISIELRNKSERIFDDKRKRKESEKSTKTDKTSSQKNRSKDISKLVLQDGSSSTSDRFAVLLPKDDLRAYAYEGEGSSDGSLGSAISDLRKDIIRVETEKTGNLPPAVGEVVDLLQNLPDVSFRFSPSHNKQSRVLQNTQRTSNRNLKVENLSKETSKFGKHPGKVTGKATTKASPTTSGSGSSSEVGSSFNPDGKSKHAFIRSSASSSFWYSPNKLVQSTSDISVISHMTEKTKSLTSLTASKSTTEVLTDDDLYLSEASSKAQMSRSSSRKLLSPDSVGDSKVSSSTGPDMNVLTHMSLHV